MRTLTLRARLTLWYTVALVLVLCLFAGQVVWQLQRLGVRRADRELDGLAGTAARFLREELREGVTPAHAAEEAIAALAMAGRAIAILDRSGAPLAASWSGLTLPDPLPAANEGARAWTRETTAGAWRLHAEPRTVEGTPFVVLVGSVLADQDRERREVIEAMEIAIPIVLLLAGGGGFWLASVGLRPIADMARDAGRISPGGIEDLGHASRRDELGQLARAFNGLVERLRAALRTQRQFMADASHELRTPISIARTAAEVALSREQRSDAEYREALTIAGDQARRLGRLVDDMLVLARADAGGYSLRPDDLDLEELVADCCRALSVLSAERRVAVTCDAPDEVPFRGDRELLRQMVLNVLQNAVQHTPAGGSVAVTLERSRQAAVIRVADEGPGIAPADQERIFDRFVQLDAARRTGGAGLGLPIARWIAEAHHGTLVVERSGDAGSTFRIAIQSLP